MTNQSISSSRAVVLHAADRADDVQRAVSTAAALRKAFPEARVRIIINGEALTAASTLDTDGLPDGASVAVCAIGLHRRGIEESEVPDGVEVIPAAPIAIVEEQFAGAAYLRL